MSGFIPEITTTVKVNIDTSGLDEAIQTVNNDTILSQCFTDLTTLLQEKKELAENLQDPAAELISDRLASWQETIISTKHMITGMMMNSVDITHDGDGQYIVGNTATSVDGFPYPLAIEQGTRNHWIAPVTYSALHWSDANGEHFSKGHMVSGITADPYVQYSIDNTLEDVEDLLRPFINELTG